MWEIVFCFWDVFYKQLHDHICWWSRRSRTVMLGRVIIWKEEGIKFSSEITIAICMLLKRFRKTKFRWAGPEYLDGYLWVVANMRNLSVPGWLIEQCENTKRPVLQRKTNDRGASGVPALCSWTALKSVLLSSDEERMCEWDGSRSLVLVFGRSHAPFCCRTASRMLKIPTTKTNFAKWPFCILWEGQLISASLVGPVWSCSAPTRIRISFCVSCPSCPKDLPNLLLPWAAGDPELQPCRFSSSVSFCLCAAKTTLWFCRGKSSFSIDKFISICFDSVIACSSHPWTVSTWINIRIVRMRATGGGEQRNLFVSEGECLTRQCGNIISCTAAEVWFYLVLTGRTG